ncbi:MAG: glutathione S-transferase domain-containing protein [Rhizobiaceae bacterium]
MPIEKMEERWKHVPNIDRLYRQQSVIREGVDSPYVMRAIGALETIFRQMETALQDDRPYLMGDQFTLAETNFAPFVKVLEMVRFLDFWLEAYPLTRVWWDRMAERPSMKQLDEFPYNAISEESVHARTGRETAPAFRAKLDEYRERFAHAYAVEKD